MAHSHIIGITVHCADALRAMLLCGYSLPARKSLLKASVESYVDFDITLAQIWNIWDTRIEETASKWMGHTNRWWAIILFGLERIKNIDQ